jgi:predicted nucleic acid-binding Zn ribbon protein
MNIDNQFELEHLYLTERKCRVCGEIKDLIDGFYLTRSGRGHMPSAYSYECKECTKTRIISNRKQKSNNSHWQYPDW